MSRGEDVNESGQSSDGTDRRTGGYCFGCSQSYSHDEWWRQSYRDGRGVAQSAAFCPHCGRLQVRTRISEDIVDSELPPHDEVIDGHNPGYLKRPVDTDTDRSGGESGVE